MTSAMRVFLAVCLLAIALGQPVKEKNKNHHITNKRSVKADDMVVEEEDHAKSVANVMDKRIFQNNNGHSVEKRDVSEDEDEHHIAKRHAYSSDDAQNVPGVAHQDSGYQEAYSNEGGIARQGPSGQYIYASDFGGPMVQVMQHAYKSDCCSCGCECDCSKENGVDGSE